MIDSFTERIHHRLHLRLDNWGAGVSLACAVHCALMPLLLMALPFIGATCIADERLEWGVVGLSALLGFSSLCLGLRRHRQRQPLALLSAGMLLVLGGRIFFELGSHPGNHSVLQGIVLLIGGGMVAGAHLWNRHLCGGCPTCQEEHACCS